MRSDDSSEPGDGRDERDPVSDSFTGGAEDVSEVRESFGRSADRRGFLKLAGAVVAAPFATGRASASESHELVVRSTEAPSELTYQFTTTGSVTRLLDEGDDSAEESNDDIVQNDDGTWTVSGFTGNGYGDAFAFEGDLVSFSPESGPFELYLDGDPFSVEDLLDSGFDHRIEIVTTADPSELSYEFETNGEAAPVIDGSRNAAEENNDDVTETDDGTWRVSGYTGNGYGDAFDYDGEIVDFAPTSGPFEVSIDGQVVDAESLTGETDETLDADGAESDDGPDHEIAVVTTEDPSELTYQFTTTGEAEPLIDREDNSAEAANDEVTRNDDGTWTVSGYTGNGYGDAFAFDGEVTEFSPMRGPFELYVDGEAITPSELTGTEPPEDSGPVVGGGAGYEATVPESDADVVVSTASELATALSRAGAGDIVYVAGDADVDLGGRELTVPAGATLASNRGIDGAAGGLLRTDREVWPSINVQRNARVTGIRFSGPHFEYTPHDPGVGIGLWARGRDVEIDNCELWGFSHAAVRAIGGTHVHHNHVHHNPMDGLGYGVLCKGGHPVIEYNEMDYNRHSVASDGSGGYTVRYNHFGPNAIDHVIDCHRPGGTTIEIHNNTIEATTQVQNDQLPPAVAIRGVPDDAARIEDNWFHNPEEPRSTPSGWTDEAIVQVHTSGWRNVDFSGNAYGSDEPDAGIGCPR